MTACEAGRPAYSESWARCGRLSHVLAPSCTRRVARSPRQFSCMQRVWALCTRPHLHKVRQRATLSAAFEGHSSPRPSSHAAQPATYTPLVHNAAAVVALVASRLPPLVGIAPCAHVRVGASCTCTNKAGAAVCVATAACAEHGASTNACSYATASSQRKLWRFSCATSAPPLYQRNERSTLALVAHNAMMHRSQCHCHSFAFCVGPIRITHTLWLARRSTSLCPTKRPAAAPSAVLQARRPCSA